MEPQAVRYTNNLNLSFASQDATQHWGKCRLGDMNGTHGTCDPPCSVASLEKTQQRERPHNPSTGVLASTAASSLYISTEKTCQAVFDCSPSPCLTSSAEAAHRKEQAKTFTKRTNMAVANYIKFVETSATVPEATGIVKLGTDIPRTADGALTKLARWKRAERTCAVARCATRQARSAPNVSPRYPGDMDRGKRVGERSTKACIDICQSRVARRALPRVKVDVGSSIHERRRESGSIPK